MFKIVIMKCDFDCLVITFKKTVTLKVINRSYNKTRTKSLPKTSLKIKNKFKVTVKNNTVKKTLIRIQQTTNKDLALFYNLIFLITRNQKITLRNRVANYYNYIKKLIVIF